GGRVLRRGEANGSRGPFAELAYGGKLGVHLHELRADAQEQPLSGLSWCDAARRPVQKPDADPLLQATNDLAERGLRHSKLRGGPRETALPRHRKKGKQVARVVSAH